MQSHPFRAWFLTFLAGTSLICAAPTWSVPTFQKLVEHGQERPDQDDPASADTFLETACGVIEGDDVVFRALHDGFRTGFDSIWTIKADGSGLRKLIGKNRGVPGGVGAFTAFGANNGGDFTTSPMLRDGRVVFFGYDSNPDANLRATGGLYSIQLNKGGLRRIANYDTPNPSDPAIRFGQFGGGSNQICHNGYQFDGRRVFFRALSPGGNTPAGVYRAGFDGKGLTRVRDDSQPDLEYNPFFPPRDFFGPSLGLDAGKGAVLYGYSGGSLFGPQALYVGNRRIQIRADSLPGDPTPDGSDFNHLQLDGKTAVFRATGGTDYLGIFAKGYASTSLRKIVSNLNDLPGLGPCPVNNIGSFVANAGRVIFHASATNCDGQTANGRMGLFLAENKRIRRIVGLGDDLGDGSSVVEVLDELGPGAVDGKRLVFGVRTTTANRALYVANLP